MDKSFQSIHYENVKHFNYMKDIKNMNASKEHTQQLKFNSERQSIDSIADTLYKKMVRQGYIQKTSQIASVQKKKKIQDKYDLGDKFIDDQSAFTDSQKKQTEYSKFRALSNTSMQDFYKNYNHVKIKSSSQLPSNSTTSLPSYIKSTKNQVVMISQMFKNPLTVIKFGQLKKKVQSNLKTDLNKFKMEIQARSKQSEQK